MGSIFEFTIRASLILLLISCIMIFITDYCTAEWVISVITASMMFILFVVSTAIFKRRNNKEKNNEDG